MFCFKKVLENCMCEKTSTPCRLCYCNCNIKSKEVQTPKCRYKECTLHLRKNEIQKQHTPLIQTKLKNSRIDSISTQIVDSSEEKNQSDSQQSKLKSTKTKKGSDESLVVEQKSKTLSDNSKKDNKDKLSTDDQSGNSKSINQRKDDSKVSNVLTCLCNTNPSPDRGAKKFRSVGGDIRFKKWIRNNTFDFRDRNIAIKGKNNQFHCRRLNQDTKSSKTSKGKECDQKLTDPDVYQNCTNHLPKSINQLSSSEKSVSSALNIFLVKQENNNSPAYLEEYTITACGRYPIQNKDCDLKRLRSGEELNKCSNHQNGRSVLEDLKCFFQQKAARNVNKKDRLIVMQRPEEWRELYGSQKILKMNNSSFKKTGNSENQNQNTKKHQYYKTASNHSKRNKNDFLGADQCQNQQIGKKPSLSLNESNSSRGNRKTNYPIYKPQMKRNTDKASCKCPKCSYKCSKSESNKRNVNDEKIVVFESQSKEDNEVNVLLKARRLRNSSVGPYILGEDPSNGALNKSKACICSPKLLQTLREQQRIQQIEKKKNRNYCKYFQNFQQKQEKRNACKCNISGTKEKPAELQQCLQGERACISCDNDSQNIQQELVLKNPLEPSESYLASYYNWRSKCQKQQQEYYNFLHRDEENTNFENLGTVSPQKQHNCYVVEDTRKGNDSQNMQSHQQYVGQWAQSVCSDDNDRIRYTDNEEFPSKQQQGNSFQEQRSDNQKWSASCEGVLKQRQPRTISNEIYIQQKHNKISTQNCPMEVPSEIQHVNCMNCYFRKSQHQTPNEDHNMQNQKECNPHSTSSDINYYQNILKQKDLRRDSQESDRIKYMDCNVLLVQRKEGESFQEQQSEDQIYSCSATSKGVLIKPKPSMDNEIFSQPSHDIPQKLQPESPPFNYYVSKLDDLCLCSECNSQKSLQRTQNESFESRCSETNSHRLSEISEKTLYFPNDTSSQCLYPQTDHEVHEQKEYYLQSTYSDGKYSQNIQQQPQEKELNGSFHELDFMICIDSDALPIQLQEDNSFQNQLSGNKECSATCECVSNQAYIQNADNEIFTEYSPKDVPQMLQLNSRSEIQPVSDQPNYYVSDFDELCSECNSLKSLPMTKNKQNQPIPLSSMYCETDFHQQPVKIMFPSDTSTQYQCQQQDHNVPKQQSTYSNAKYSKNLQQRQKGQELNRNSQEADIMRYIICDALPVQQEDEDSFQEQLSQGTLKQSQSSMFPKKASQPDIIKLNCYDNYLHYFEKQQPEQQDVQSGYSLKSFKNSPQYARLTLQDQQLDSLYECELTSFEEMNPNEAKPPLQRETNDRFYSTLRPCVTQSTFNMADHTDSKQTSGPWHEAQEMEGSTKKPMKHSDFYWRIIKKYDIQPIPDDCSV